MMIQDGRGGGIREVDGSPENPGVYRSWGREVRGRESGGGRGGRC